MASTGKQSSGNGSFSDSDKRAIYQKIQNVRVANQDEAEARTDLQASFSARGRKVSIPQIMAVAAHLRIKAEATILEEIPVSDTWAKADINRDKLINCYADIVWNEANPAKTLKELCRELPCRPEVAKKMLVEYELKLFGSNDENKFQTIDLPDAASIALEAGFDPEYCKRRFESSQFSFEKKEKWRQKWFEFLEKYTTEEQRANMRVICIPSSEVLPEVKYYLKLGFKPENILAVEREPKKYDEFIANAEAIGIQYKTMSIEDAIQDIGTDHKFDVVNLDFCGNISEDSIETMHNISVSTNGFVIVNYLAKRERKEIQSILDQVAHGEDREMKRVAIKHHVELEAKQKGKSVNSKETQAKIQARLAEHDANVEIDDVANTREETGDVTLIGSVGLKYNAEYQTFLNFNFPNNLTWQNADINERYLHYKQAAAKACFEIARALYGDEELQRRFDTQSEESSTTEILGIKEEAEPPSMIPEVTLNLPVRKSRMPEGYEFLEVSAAQSASVAMTNNPLVLELEKYFYQSDASERRSKFFSGFAQIANPIDLLTSWIRSQDFVQRVTHHILEDPDREDSLDIKVVKRNAVPRESDEPLERHDKVVVKLGEGGSVSIRLDKLCKDSVAACDLLAPIDRRYYEELRKQERIEIV